MGNVTSMDLRSRIVQAVEVEGMSAAARRNASWSALDAIKLLKHKETTGGVAPKRSAAGCTTSNRTGHAARHRRGNAGHDTGEDRKRGRCARA